jgi:hypothetical protein
MRRVFTVAVVTSALVSAARQSESTGRYLASPEAPRRLSGWPPPNTTYVGIHVRKQPIQYSVSVDLVGPAGGLHGANMEVA